MRDMAGNVKLLFLVNGTEQSAAAMRVQAFASRLPDTWQMETRYRPASKWKGIAPFVRCAREFQPDIIYVMDTAYTGVLAGYFSKRIMGARLIVDTGDAAYELAKSTGNYSAKALMLIRQVERIALHRSDAVVTRGSYHRELLMQQGVEKCAFIPDGVDMKQIAPVDGASVRREFNLGSAFVLGVVGSMNWSQAHKMCYGWDVVEAVGLLKDANVRGLLVGDGDGRVHLEKRAQELGISERIAFVGAVPSESLPRYICAMDACLSTQSNDIVGNVRTTGKLPLYLACDRYVVATDVGEARRVLRDVGCLLPYEGVRDTGYPACVAEHVRELLKQGIRWKDKTPRAIAAENFDYDLLALRVQQLCCELMGNDVLVKNDVAV